MSRRRAFAIALLLGAIAGGAWQIAGPQSRREETVTGPVVESQADIRHEVERAETERVVHFWSEPAREVRTGDDVDAPAREVAANDRALVGEMAALQALAQGSELELAPRQWAALAAATLHIQAVRQAYEATLATVTKSAPGRYRVDVPAYPAAGDALRAKFHAELRAQLGEDATAEVLTHLGRALEGHFAGFGVSVQTLEFAGGEVTRTVRFWNAVDGHERLTTRRETHFPALEDPTGELWSPYMARVAAAGGAGDE